MEEPEDLRRATELWQEAYRHQMDGELDRAMERYQRSIEVYPTAEAHTFMGWALSVQGRLDEATDECRRAIEIDPQFGNPYNDIGVYLTQQGKPDEAIPWLEKAKQATRYEPRQYPFMNLGRIYLRQGAGGRRCGSSRGRCGQLRMTAPLARRCMSSALASTDPVWFTLPGSESGWGKVEGKATRRDRIPSPLLARRSSGLVGLARTASAGVASRGDAHG